MKHVTTIFTICCVSLLLLLTACDQKPAPLKTGVITKVVWTSDGKGWTGLYRGNMPEKPQPGQGGEYGVDIHGILYPSHLEVQFLGSSAARSQIIPFTQIVFLEFGDGSVPVGKP